MSHRPLDGKAALVTGGGIGIGSAIAQRLAADGADVAITWHRHADEGLALLASLTECGGRALGFDLDATASADVNAVVSSVLAEFGHIDILVNNAGGLLRRSDIEHMSDKHWHDTLEVNLSSAFYFSRAVAPHFGNSGRVVNIASQAGQNGGGQGSGAYAASKAGMFGLTRGLAKELSRRQVTVNAVAPGLILDTPFHEEFTPVDSQNATIDKILMGRAGTPTDVAGLVAWLCGPEAGWLTGEVINLNGGENFF